MSDEKPSPGPWKWSERHRGWLVASNDRWVMSRPADVECAPADARLIAAAPEMAELLRDFVAAWEKFVRDNDDGAGDGVLAEDPLAVRARALLARLGG